MRGSLKLAPTEPSLLRRAWVLEPQCSPGLFPVVRSLSTGG